MTQACLRRASVVIPGTEKCELNGEEENEGGQCSRSFGQQENQLTEAGHSGENSKMHKIQEKIQEGLERTISAETKDKIEKILNDANQLSDVEKLLLYLKLPTGSALAYSKDGSAQMLQSSNRLEQIQAVTWIKSHLEEHSETSLPKQEVFDDYKMYCEGHGYKFLSQGDFGKVMKCVFPNVKPRRLGQRGQSKHCYGGLRKKLQVGLPTLPVVNIDPVPEVKEESEGVVDEVLQSSCELVLEWAHKLLNQQFSNIKSLAEYLVSSNYVNGRSMAAFTVLAAIQNNEGPKTPVSSGTQGQSSSKHRETQLQLQRKLQERELLREQKRKLEMNYTDYDMERRAIEITPDWSTQSQVATKLETSAPKQQTSATVQKLLLPKTSSANSQTGSTGSTAVMCSTSTVAQTQLPVKTLPSNAANLQTNNGAGNQSILVFSPTAHLGQSGSVIPQQLLILSPISAGNANNTTPVTAIRPQSIASLPQAVTGNKAAGMPTLVPMQQVVVNTIAGQPQTAMSVTTLSLAGSNPSSALLSRGMTTTASQVALANSLPTLHQTPTLVTSNSQILTTARTLEVETNSHQQPVQSNTNGLGPSAFIPVSGQINHGLRSEENLLADLSCDGMTIQSDDSQGLTNDFEDMRSPSSPNSNSSLLSPNSAAFSSNHNSDSNKSGCGSGRQKLQPRTVSSMLKEQRGCHIVIDNKSAYVNDNRPVSALLKESRQRQALAGTGSVITNALSPNTLMIQAVHVNNTNGAISNSNSTLGNQSESSNGVMVNGQHQALLAAALLQVNEANCSSDNSQSSCSPPVLLPVSSAGFSSFNPSSSVKLERHRHCSGPEHKSELAAFLNGLESNKGQKRELQTPDLPKQKRNLANDGRNRSHHGLDCRNHPKDHPLLSVAASLNHHPHVSLDKHLLRTDSFDKDMSDKDALLESFTGEPAPDLNDITPSIDQMVNSQDEDSLGQPEQQQNKHVRLPSLSAATASSLGVPAAAMLAVSKQLPITNQSNLMSILSGGHDKSVRFFSNQQSLSQPEQHLQQHQQAFPSQLRGDVLLSQVSKPFPDPSSRVRHRSAGAAVTSSQLISSVLKSNSLAGNSPSIRKLLSSKNDNNNAQQQQQQQRQQHHGNKNGNGSLPLSSALSRLARRAQSVGSASIALQQQQQQVMGGSMPASPMMSPASNTSANSTPVPSPGSVNPNQKQDSDQTVAAFVPIQTSQQGINAKLALVKPSFTATSSQTPTKVQGPKLQNVAGNINVAPASATGKKVISSNPIIRERLARKLKDTGNNNSASAHSNDQFVAASTIKPVKRGQKLSQKSNSASSKRQRHHSAQSALQSNNAAVSSPASIVANYMQQGLMQQLDQQSLRQLLNSQDSQLSPALTSTDQTNGRTSFGPSTPESPFSPEMQDIFGNSLTNQPNMVGSSFRSQSVPVSETFYTGSDNQDLFQTNTSMMIQQRDSSGDFPANGSHSELANLLQERLNDETENMAKTSDVFGARRNLTELLDTSDNVNSQPGGAMLCSSSRRCQHGHSDYESFISKGDMMLPSLSMPDNSLMDALEGHQHAAPTPPTSKNPTPDFSHELSSLQSSANGMVSMQGGSKLDTPSSLDTLSTHSRESLNDHQLFPMYDSNAVMTNDVTVSDIDMMGSDYFQNWDMAQMVHD